MGSVTCWSGAWKTCPSCGKLFYVTDCERWVYKRNVSEKGTGEVKHFCKWSCLLKFDREYEEMKKRKRSESAKEQHKRQNDRRKEELDGRTCGECRYCMKGKYGFYDCAVKDKAVSTTRSACYRFKETYQKEGEKT